MKKLILLSSIVFLLNACKNNNSKPAAASVDSVSAPVPVALKSSELDGFWTGAFSNSDEDEALRAKAQAFENSYFEKLNKGQGDENDGDNYITDLKVIPAELRKVYYKEPLGGFYTFRAPNKVSVIIDGINEAGELIGRSICAGNERPIKGSFSKSVKGIKAELKEPGDSLNDGIFTIEFIGSNAEGSWKSKTGNIKPLVLNKTQFKYDPEAGNMEGFRQKNENGWIEFKKNPSKDLLTTKDVENLTRPELTILRNLVFARHGYTFQNAAYRNYFEATEWYMPYKKDIRADLTELEKKNTDKLKSFEKYASDAYDEFGR